MSQQQFGSAALASCCVPASGPLGPEQAAQASAVFKVLADPVRLRLLALIAARAGGEVCVCELAESFELAQPTISHHLKVLRSAGLVDCQRRGTWVYYWALPRSLEHVRHVMDELAVPSNPPVGQVRW